MRRTVLAAATAVAATPVAAFGATTGNLREEPLPDATAGSFLNYDFGSRSAVATNVDWPVTLVFAGPTASVASVRSLLSAAGYSFTGSTEYGYVRQGAGTLKWVADGGRKRSFRSLSVQLPGAPRIGAFSYVHVRLYAPSSGAFVAADGTRYVVATTHVDLNELFSPVYGWSESAEQQLARYDLPPLVARGRVAAIVRDGVPLENPEGTDPAAQPPDANVPLADVGARNHRWQNDGRATLVRLP